jgi:hypothetical protein
LQANVVHRQNHVAKNLVEQSMVANVEKGGKPIITSKPKGFSLVPSHNQWLATVRHHTLVGFLLQVSLALSVKVCNVKGC